MGSGTESPPIATTGEGTWTAEKGVNPIPKVDSSPVRSLRVIRVALSDPELEPRMCWYGQLRPAPSSGDHTDSGACRSPDGRACASAEHSPDRCATNSPDGSSSRSSGAG